MRARETFRYYKLQYEDRGGLGARLRETSIYKQRAGNSTPLAAMTSNNTPAPYVASATTDSANAYLAFDDTSNHWGIGNSGRVELKIDCGPDRQAWRDASFILQNYDASGRNPDEIVLFGSHDDKTYTLLGGIKNVNNLNFGGNNRYFNINEKSKPTILYKMMYSGFVPSKKPNFFPLLMKGINL